MIKKWVLVAFGVALCSPAVADGYGCGVPTAIVNKIQTQLGSVVLLNNGGIFGVGGVLANPGKTNLMWSAVVDRYGKLCSVVKYGDAWPGSRAIAIANGQRFQ